MKTENKPSIKTVRFGDGYEQRSPNGLNHSLRVFTCDFKVEANERDSFNSDLVYRGIGNISASITTFTINSSDTKRTIGSSC